VIECDYIRDLGWWLDLLDSLINAWLHFTFHYCTNTLVSTVTFSLPLLGSGFQRRTFSFLWIPELSPGLSYQLLTVIAHNDWTSAVLWLVLHITSRHGPRSKHCCPHLPHCCVRVCWGDHVIATEPLPSNGPCLQSHSVTTAVSAGFAILPWADMPQYCNCLTPGL
jgi:hypothetical protein